MAALPKLAENRRFKAIPRCQRLPKAAVGLKSAEIARYVNSPGPPAALTNAKAFGTLSPLLVTMMQAMGLSPSDYQKFGKVGFGEYARHKTEHAAHYAPFKTDTAKNQALPFLYL